MAGKVGRGQSVRGPVVEVAGSACQPNHQAAEGDQKRREVASEPDQRGEIERYGAFVGKERSNPEDPGRLNAHACAGRRSETSVGLSRDREFSNDPPNDADATQNSKGQDPEKPQSRAGWPGCSFVELVRPILLHQPDQNVEIL